MFEFPKDFTWGVATSSIQIEGASREDGKSESVWDVYCREKDIVADGSTPDIACDSYHRYQKDIAMMQDLGVNGYRFSMSWCRILPQGRGQVNQKGVDYYNRLIDALLDAGIQPYVTLYHWDMPQCIEDECGWRDRKIADIFAEYAARAAELFGDRVKHWVPFNEIHAFVDQGYGMIYKAPGLDLGKDALPQIYHHVLLSHGKAIQAMRAVRDDLKFGCAENTHAPIPVIETPENIEAARKAWNLDIGRLFQPMALGSYPEGMTDLPHDIRDGDMETIGQGLDFIGTNIYGGTYVEAADTPEGYRVVPYPEGYPSATKETWLHITPEVAYWCIRHAAEAYNIPEIYIMENGFSTPADLDPAADLQDLDRLHFLRQYMTWMHRALEEGYPIKGYFLWSLMDSFEWISGYQSNFGIYQTNFETLERTPRLTAKWYKELILQGKLV